MIEAKENLRSASVWAREINRALKQGIVNAGFKNLLLDLTILDKVQAALVYSTALWLTIASQSLISLVYQIPLIGTMWTLMDSVTHGVEDSGAGRRVSLFLGPEIDRAVVLYLLTKTWPLVREISQNRE